MLFNNNSFYYLVLTFVLFFFVLDGLLWAQPVPEAAKAGVLESQRLMKEELKEYEEVLHIIEWEYLSTERQMPQAAKIFVEGYNFSGNTVFGEKMLKRLLKDFTQKNLTFADLETAAQIITNYYRQKGYFLAKAYIPPQDIRNKTVLVEIIEGKLGTIGVQFVQDKKLVSKILEKYFDPAKNNIIHYRKLLRSILVINENTSINVKTYLQKGRDNFVNIIVEAKEEKKQSARMVFDNYGSRFVARQRALVELSRDNAFLVADKLVVTGGMGFPVSALGFSKAEYTKLINSSGSRLGLSYFWLDSDVQREFRSLDSGGGSKVYSFSFYQPLIKTIATNVEASLSFDIKNVSNYLLGEISSKDNLRNIRFELSSDHLDSFRGRNFYSLSTTFGIADILNGSPTNSSLASRVGAGGEFQKYRLEVARAQSLPKEITAHLRGAYQFSSDVLPSTEQFSIGGINTVRGFPQSEALGDHGIFGSLEFRFAPPFISQKQFLVSSQKIKEMIYLTCFFDYGKIHLKNPQLGESQTQELLGAGLGVRADINKNISARADAGFPVGVQKPSDDSEVTVYFQLSVNF